MLFAAFSTLAMLPLLPSAGAVYFAAHGSSVHMHIEPSDDMDAIWADAWEHAAAARAAAESAGHEFARSDASIVREIRAHAWGNEWGREDPIFGLEYDGAWYWD